MTSGIRRNWVEAVEGIIAEIRRAREKSAKQDMGFVFESPIRSPRTPSSITVAPVTTTTLAPVVPDSSSRVNNALRLVDVPAVQSLGLVSLFILLSCRTKGKEIEILCRGLFEFCVGMDEKLGIICAWVGVRNAIFCVSLLKSLFILTLPRHNFAAHIIVHYAHSQVFD